MTINTVSRGRKAIVYNEQSILNIIYECSKELKIKGKLKYSQVYKYVLKKFQEGEYPFFHSPPSEDYWRKANRQGRQLIDKVNEIDEVAISGKIEDNLNVSETIISTEDAVNKLFNGNVKDKKKLINHLRTNEIKAKKYYKQAIHLKNNLEKVQEEKTAWKNKAENLQILLFQIMEYSASKDFPIENFINTGKTRTPLVNNILEQMFSENPALAFDFNNYQKNRINNEMNDASKIVDINNKRSAADDFGLF